MRRLAAHPRRPGSHAPRRTPAFGLVAVLVTALALGGCGDDDAGGIKPGPKVDEPDSSFVSMTGKADVGVEALDNLFKEQFVTVTKGTKVTWTNRGRNMHNIIASNDGGFPTATTDKFAPGASYSVTFDKTGDYPYYCSVHGTKKSGQHGAIRVVDA